MDFTELLSQLHTVIKLLDQRDEASERCIWALWDQGIDAELLSELEAGCVGKADRELLAAIDFTDRDRSIRDDMLALLHLLDTNAYMVNTSFMDTIVPTLMQIYSDNAE